MEINVENYNPKQNNPLNVTSTFSEDIKNITGNPNNKKQCAAKTTEKLGKYLTTLYKHL